jgi:GH25 family lysozyme M1 (1,4-beta-N-acetylmuramidase)/uncharacterized protein YgiM (DUF1202 family)
MGNAIGPDVSFYQDDPTTPQHIDFAKMRNAADYVIIRAGQNLWPDRDLKRNWAAAKAVGLPRGSYWFYDSRADPKRQAELWVETMEGDLGELPLFADFEEAYGGPHKGWRKWFDFLERLKELVGQKEIAIYTAYYYWRDNAPNPNTEPQNLEYFHQYPLWIANYGVTTPSIPKPWGANEWLFWQFTEVGDGKLYGVESKGIDLNYFNGDVDAFRKRFGLTQPPPGGVEYRVELRIRKGPSMDEDEVGMLRQNEVLEVLDTSPDGNWMQVKRSDDATGWIFNTHLIKVEAPPPPPPPPVDKWYRVTAVKLNVRSGPGTNFEDIGDLFRDEVVKALEYAENNTWIKILRSSDGLTGWCSADFLQETDAPPDNGEPPVEEEWYRVTASALNVRQDPSTSATIVGSLPFNSVVKALEKNDDKTWIKILRASDGLTGWCFASYLELTDPPNPPDGGEPPPPVTEPKTWYQVKASTLNVRSGPSTSNEKVGTLTQGQVIVKLEANEDGSWVRIQRFDGLVGWCAVSYLTDLGTTAPEKLTQKIFNGVTYFRQEMQTARKMVAHVLAVDMRVAGLKSLVTPASHSSGLVCTRKTSKFLEEFGLQVAINGDGFSYVDQDTYPPSQYCANGGEPVDVNSYAASRGTVYSQRWDSRPILYINKNNEVSFNQPSGAVFNAVSGDRMLVDKGKRVANLESQSVEPRSAAGLNQNGRWLFLVVIDGRQAGYSLGATFPELADFMISLGAYTALNLDGGGSSALAIESVMGGPFVLNSPIEGMIPGNESAVANHLGFWVKK